MAALGCWGPPCTHFPPSGSVSTQWGVDPGWGQGRRRNAIRVLHPQGRSGRQKALPPAGGHPEGPSPPSPLSPPLSPLPSPPHSRLEQVCAHVAPRASVAPFKACGDLPQAEAGPGEPAGGKEAGENVAPRTGGQAGREGKPPWEPVGKLTEEQERHAGVGALAPARGPRGSGRRGTGLAPARAAVLGL